MTRLTESEFWTAVADYMEATGEMTPHKDGYPSRGLCYAVSIAHHDFVIPYAVKQDALRRIARALLVCGKRTYLARPGRALPRIVWARKFAEESKP